MAGKLVKTIFDTRVFTVQTGYFYNREDCWAHIEDSNAKVGVSEYMQKSKGEIVALETIEAGSEVKQGQEIGKVETMKAVFTIISPVTGRIMEVNHQLKSNPPLINNHPYGAGWILTGG